MGAVCSSSLKSLTCRKSLDNNNFTVQMFLWDCNYDINSNNDFCFLQMVQPTVWGVWTLTAGKYCALSYHHKHKNASFEFTLASPAVVVIFRGSTQSFINNVRRLDVNLLAKWCCSSVFGFQSMHTSLRKTELRSFNNSILDALFHVE